MIWLKLLHLFLGLAGSMADIAEDRQLLEAGAAQEMKESLSVQQDKVRSALAAGRNAKFDADSLRNDKSNRGRKGD